MSQDTSHARTAQVAVGATRELAARAFGREHDDLVLTSFDDLGAEVDLSAYDAVHVTLGPGVGPTLQAVAAAQRLRPDLALWTTPPSDDPSDLLPHLDGAGLRIAEVRGLPHGVRLRLEPRGADPGGDDALVLQALLAATVPESTDSSQPPVAPAPSTGDRAERGPKPRPVPRLVEALGSARRLVDGPRRRAAALVALLVALVVLVALGSWLSRDGGALLLVVPLVGLGVAGATGLVLAAVLLLARQVHTQTGRQERMLLRNRAVLAKQTTAIERRLRNIEAGTARYPFALSYLETLAELAAETSARVKALEDTLGDRADPAGPPRSTPVAPPEV